jgi:hypothetical protein
MNMISTVPFLAEADATNKQAELVKKLTGAWEKKNSKAARAGGVSLMAVSLAACGGEDTTPFSQADIDTAVNAVDTSADDAAAILAAVQAVDANATTVSEVATNAAAAVDTSADDDAAILLALRNEAASLGVTDTVNMTRAELVTAIKTANDTAVADAVDLTTNDTAAINAAVAADTSFDTLAELVAAYNALANPSDYTPTTGVNTISSGSGDNNFDATTASTLNSTDSITDSSTADADT